MSTVTVTETRYTVDVSGVAPTVVTESAPEVIEVEEKAHPSLADHDTLGLATQAELDAHALTPHGGTHPDLAAHDTLGLATQAELNTHEADTTSVHGITNTEDLIRRAGALTAGSILFASGANEAQQDNANLFWDDANNRFGIGTSSPATRFVVREDVAGVSVGMRLENLTTGINRGVKLQFVSGTTPTESAGLIAAWEGAGLTTSYFAFNTRSASGTTEKMRLTSSGALGLAFGGVIPLAHLHVISGSATEITQILQGAASQSGNLFQLRDSTGAVLTAFDSAGALDLSGTATGAGINAVVKMSSRTVEGFPSGLNKNAGFEFFNLAGQDANSSLFGGGVASDAFRRIRITASGQLRWGSGTAAVDTNLYRSAADTLKTDDKLHVVDEFELDGALNHDGTTAGFYGVVPVTQPTGIADADGTLADITTKFNSLLSKLETIGLLAVA